MIAIAEEKGAGSILGLFNIILGSEGLAAEGGGEDQFYGGIALHAAEADEGFVPFAIAEGLMDFFGARFHFFGGDRARAPDE